MNHPLRNMIDRVVASVRDINQKYRQPRVQITPGVKFALLALRLYLFIMVGLLLYKFITLIK